MGSPDIGKSMKGKRSIPYPSPETSVILIFVCATVALHLLLPEYGYHRDELYYVAIGDNWSFQNFDMLPLGPLYLRLFTFLFGHSIRVVHLASSLCTGLTIMVSCLITKEFGGRIYAILLTGTLLTFSSFMAFGSIFTLDSTGFLIWVILLYAFAKVLKEDKPDWWIVIGIVFGIGLLNKMTILFLPPAVIFSLLFVPQRTFFKRRWIWLAGIIAIPFLVPFLLWQKENYWYFFGFASEYVKRSYQTSFIGFLRNQIIPNGIFSFPVWLTGLYLLMFSSRWKIYRAFGICYLFLYFIFFFLDAPSYFLLALYAVLYSVGSIKIEEVLDKWNVGKNRMRMMKLTIPAVYVALSLPLLPLAIPVLPVDQLVHYVTWLGLDAGNKTNSNAETLLPQHFADRFGWEEMVCDIAKVYHDVDSAQYGEIGVLTGNYGEAAAVHLYRDKYKLPEPISTNGWFYFEALRTHGFKSMYVSIGLSWRELEDLFTVVERKSVFTNPYSMWIENNQPIYLCSGPKYDLRSCWLVESRIDPYFRRLMDSIGVAGAIEYYYTFKKNHPSVVLFNERQINNLGYEYMQKGMIDDAIALFELNVQQYPTSAKTYDSLADAYMAKGSNDLAIQYYRESLRRNPGNANAKEKLLKLVAIQR